MKSPKTDIVETAQVRSPSTSFELLFLEHWSQIFRLLCRLVGDPSEAEDLPLETFFRLYQRHPLPENELNVAGWLHRVATNLGLHSIRSFKRRERYELAAGKFALEETGVDQPPGIIAEQEERDLARVVLARMNKRQAQILLMRHSGMAYKDISEALGLSPTSIGPLLLRAERDFEKRYRVLIQEEP